MTHSRSSCCLILTMLAVSARVAFAAQQATPSDLVPSPWFGRANRNRRRRARRADPRQRAGARSGRRDAAHARHRLRPAQRQHARADARLQDGRGARLALRHPARRRPGAAAADADCPTSGSCWSAPKPSGLSWPTWRSQPRRRQRADRRACSTTGARATAAPDAKVTLTGHSGGGSFMFGVIEAGDEIPATIDRIAFLDANYNFDAAKHARQAHPLAQRRRVAAADRHRLRRSRDHARRQEGRRPRPAARSARRSAWSTLSATSSRSTELETAAVHRVRRPRRPHPVLRASQSAEQDSAHGAGRRHERPRPRPNARHAAGRQVGQVRRPAGVREMDSAGADADDSRPRPRRGEVRRGAPRSEQSSPLNSRRVPPTPPPAAPSPSRSPRSISTPAKPPSSPKSPAAISPSSCATSSQVPIAATLPDGTQLAGTIEVMPDYLAVGSDDDFVRMPMTPQTAQQIADLFGCMLPTRKMVDAIDAAAEVRLAPAAAHRRPRIGRRVRARQSRRSKRSAPASRSASSSPAPRRTSSSRRASSSGPTAWPSTAGGNSTASRSSRSPSST